MKSKLLVASALALGVSGFSASFVSAADSYDYYRVQGDDRYKTAVEVSKDGWEEGSSEVAVIASGTTYPDALSAVPLAHQYGAPVLLTKSTGLSQDVINELERLGVTNVFVVGGEVAISNEVIEDLDALSITSERIAGETRYETSVKVAEEIGLDYGYVLASGQNYPDALSIAPNAALALTPILLTKNNEIPAAVQEYIDANEFSDLPVVVGGENAISDDSIEGLGDVVRLAGLDRYETNQEVIEYYGDNDFTGNTFPYIATGQSFPDALTAAAAAAYYDSSVVLTNPTTPRASTVDLVDNYLSSTVDVYTVVGGEVSLPEETIESLLGWE
ncbi:hypothetical protein JMA_28830 [Jeotgalibacillus malaysiensis]|uniref:N-acetylmuramoyl-L-alanine amidase n=1 Tax=Jeotgalibacillus malaysiensis TaxID=1508404 RepID=A0A0B5APM6_9BACL|nr:cell wall-binding repeat-containing protein [Jeotgalibacillus malaysiensis]AJD92200.1 hypothetical protein JMA_28830 [Jeotgalibacillus malaysiensis]